MRKNKLIIFIFFIIMSLGVLCSCGNEEKEHIHEWIEINKTTATCTEEGKIIYSCNGCDETKVDIIEQALGHAEVIDEEVAPTCTTTGLTEGKHCSVCNEVLVAQEVVSALGHKESEAVVETNVLPTCILNGSNNLVVYCSVCKEELSRETVVVEALGHDYKSELTVPTCTTMGYTTYTCHCGYSYHDDEVAALGHTEVIDKAVEATCTTTGLTEGKHCSVCNKVLVEQQIVPVLGHKASSAVVENNILPTCTLDGSYDSVVYCSVCNEELSRNTVVVPMLGHTYETEVTVPTCTTKGYTTYTCHCGHSYVADEVEALGHTEVIDEAVAATCTTTGLTEGKHCSVCNEGLVAQKVVEALGHKESEAVVENNVLPTCTVDGSYDSAVYCSVCNEELSRETVVVPALGHTEVIDEAVAATCTQSGLTEGKHCSVCEEVLVKQEIIPALGHNVSDWVTVINATSDTDGLKNKVCLNCSVLYEEAIIPCTNPSSLAYSVNDDGLTCTITGMGSCTDTKIVIPSSIDGYIVTTIGSGAFSNQKTITSVVMQDSVTVISATAFNNCTKLTKITLSKNLTNIGTGSGVVFNKCTSLKDVYYHGTIESWCNIKISSEKANPMSFATNFYVLDKENNYSLLTSIVVPESIKEIGKYQFVGFDKVVSLDLGNVETVGIYAFKDCTNLSNVIFSDCIKNLYMGCFYNSGLTNVVLPNTIVNLGNKVFQACKKLQTITLSNSIESIPEYALYGCTSLTTVIIPKSVTKIGDFAFNASTNLKNVYFEGTVEEWGLITINQERNSVLCALTINYNYVIE